MKGYAGVAKAGEGWAVLYTPSPLQYLPIQDDVSKQPRLGLDEKCLLNSQYPGLLISKLHLQGVIVGVHPSVSLLYPPILVSI